MAGKIAPRALKLDDAAGLLAALRDSSIKLRLAVLQAIERDPAGALRLGSLDGWDVVDELVHQSYQSCSLPYYRALMRALGGFEDPRVETLFAKVALQANDPEILTTVVPRTSPAGSGSAESAAGPSPD